MAVLVVLTLAGIQSGWGRDLKVTLPERSHYTPVQRLNRDGVEAIRKHQYEKAESLFYKAYLYDPADPFTLNNLGYISELQGKLERAQKFYTLASQQSSSALIDVSNSKQLEGKPMTYALNSLKDVPMHVNRMNVEAIDLLGQGQNFEADALLQQALALEPQNPFTLNNLGVAEEATGDVENALKHYDAAANLHSEEPIVVTFKRSLRGKPVSEVAADSARQLRKRIRNVDLAELRSRMFSIRGVAAINQNDWPAAKQDFQQAYALQPDSAFTLNNLGYVSEKTGDIETAKFYYAKAQKSNDANARVGMATQSTAEGQQLAAVAGDSNQKVDSEIDKFRQAAREQTGPVQLLRRDNTPVTPSTTPDKSSAPASPGTGSQVPNQPSVPIHNQTTK